MPLKMVSSLFAAAAAAVATLAASSSSSSSASATALSAAAAAAASSSQVPSTMNAVVCMRELAHKNYSAMDEWLTPLPVPTPVKSQVLIRVVGSSVNPCDVDLVKSFEAVLARGLHKTLGFDVSGVVVALGPETDGRLKVGDEVWTDLGEMGLSSTEKVVEMGAFAEFAIADEHQVGLKPANLTFAQAGVVPLVGLTNLESFYAAGAPWYNQTNVTVVVTSGQGGTGHIAVPMAKALGARTVISTASTANVEWVKSLGADIVVDFTKESVWSVLPDDSVDVVYDNIGLPGNADAAMKSLRTGGHLVMIQGDLSEHPKPGVSQTRLLCKADDYHLLDTIADMVNVGNISDVRLQQSFPLASIGEAYNEQASGSVVGKVAIAIGVAPNSSASAQGY